MHQLGAEVLGITRRSFLRGGTLTALGLPTLRGGAETTRSAQANFKPSADLLTASVQTASWVRSAERKTPQGSFWLPEPDHPEKLTTISPAQGFYSGSAGTLLFFLQLGKATQDRSYLEDARRAADYLASTWREADEAAQLPAARRYSFYNGLAGTAFALTETWKATGDARYKDAAIAITDKLVEAAQPAGAGIAWSNSPGVGADGGVVLYLLYAANALGRGDYRIVAKKAGERITELGERSPQGGTQWRGGPPPKGLSAETYFPNFEMGTAGIAYVLARLFEETGDTRFLDAAKSGAEHLQNIAVVDHDSALIPYRLPDLANIYYLGFCHGPAGSARLFYQLHKITKQDAYLDWTERLAHGVIRSGIPDTQTPGYWNVVCQCCGSAGVTDFFLGLWAATGKDEYYAFANRLAEQTLGQHSNLDGKGLRWYQAWTRVKPWDVNAETGYSIGASGVGSALLHAALAQQGRYEAILLPDNPFPASRHEDLEAARRPIELEFLP